MDTKRFELLTSLILKQLDSMRRLGASQQALRMIEQREVEAACRNYPGFKDYWFADIPF